MMFESKGIRQCVVANSEMKRLNHMDTAVNLNKSLSKIW